MGNPWTMKMEQFTRFSPEERQRLDDRISKKHVRYEARQDILSDGEHSKDVHLVLEGLACRYKLLPDGSRQIMAFMVPGDLCDAEIFILKAMDHAVAALSPTTVALISSDEMRKLTREVSSISEALWWSTLIDLAILRERIIDHGRRDARERIAHLLYELLVRYRMVGTIEDETIPFPLTQADLADATGLTPVHVNRMLRGLREDGLIEITAKTLTVTNPEGLKEAAQFNAAYLHLDRARNASNVTSNRVGDLL